MSLGFALPVLFAFLVFALLRRTAPLAWKWREACLAAAVITALYLVAITELLSALRALDPFAVVAAWLLGLLVLLFLRVKHKAVSPAPRSLLRAFLDEEPVAQILHLLTALLALLLLVVATVAVPNSWDAMTYHLSRVFHWYENHSIVLFATSCLYQNQHSPFAEWAILHLFLLQGTDQLANLVAWAGYVGSILAVSLLAEACGGTRTTCAFAGFLAATVPMAILQAAGVQTDQVLALWILYAACACLRVAAQPAWPGIFFFAASLGLALLTKALAYLFAPAFCLWIAWSLLRRGFRFAAPRLLAIAGIVLLLNLGYYARNWTSSGTLLGSDHDSGPGYNYENEIHTPGATFSNALRNLALQAPQFPGSTHAAEAVVVRLHRFFGLDPSDPRLTNYAPYFYLPTSPLDDEIANPLQVGLILAAFLLLPVLRRRVDPSAHILALAVLFGAFLFCLVLKWQPFHSRLHLPLILLSLPVVAVVLQVLGGRWLRLVLIGLLLVGALPLVLANPAHPLFGTGSIFWRAPSAQRFLLRSGDLAAYQTARQILQRHGTKILGVLGPVDNSGWEYPLVAPGDGSAAFPWREEQIGVRNFYSDLETRAPVDAVVSLRPSPGDTVTIRGTSFRRVFQSPALSVYLK